jgi:ribosome maturation factor RimP
MEHGVRQQVHKRTAGGGVSVAAVSRQRVHEVLLPVVTEAGFDLEDVNVTAAGRRSVVRVIVDRDGGVDLDAVAEISRVVSEVLDADDVTGNAPFTLEVTSPGVDRPLTEPRHWRRNTGRLVQTTVAGSSVTGRLLAADDTGVTLDVGGAEQAIAYTELGAGKVQIEFSRPESSA